MEVDKALEENFEECEKSKERKAKENGETNGHDAKSDETNGVKPETDGVKSEETNGVKPEDTNGVKSEDTNGVKSEETNGDAMETDDVKSDSLIPFNT